MADRVDTGADQNCMMIYREKEALVAHAPPSALMKYDAILLNECSQIDNPTGRKLAHAIDELPQKPCVGIAADCKQVQPVGSGGYMASIEFPTRG